MKTLQRILLVLSLISISCFYACETDDTGDDTTDPRDEFVGVWRFTETPTKKSALSQSYIVTMSKDESNSSQLLLENLCNPGVSGSDAVGILTISTIMVTNQTLPNSWVIEGSGKKTGTGLMSWTYSITAGGDKMYYIASASKL